MTSGDMTSASGDTTAGGRPVRVETRSGAGLPPILPELRRLRVQVFRDWPYLYDGADKPEAGYSGVYLTSPAAAIVVAWDGARCVGASTCLPLADETANVVAPFLSRGWDAGDFFYFGESVLLPAYRGRGIGVEFFRQREAHARARSDARYACFCAVQRPGDHPARPPGDEGLAAFWGRRGYAPLDLHCTMRWKDVGQAEETPHSLRFWAKPLHGAPLPA